MKCPERTKRAGWSQHRGEEGRESLGGYNVKMCKRQKKFLDTATSTQNLQHSIVRSWDIPKPGKLSFSYRWGAAMR